MATQIKFYDKDNDVEIGGILLDDGSIICGCCGGLIEPDLIEPKGNQFKILKEYPWIDISEAIFGGE